MAIRYWLGVGALLASVACRDVNAPTEAAPASTKSQGSISPTAALVFWQLSAGRAHSCGVTTDYRAYCWGDEDVGEIGNGRFNDCSFGCYVGPTAVAGGLSFKQVDASYYTTCAVTPDNRAYCWGSNLYGQLGTGTTTGPEGCPSLACSTTPVAVTGGHSFRQVSAGAYHACAVATDNRAYCWGQNINGQLGDGTTTQRVRPEAVLGGLFFSRVSAGESHTCGITTDHRAYCWGYNRYGQVGDSSGAWKRLKPVRVRSTQQFRDIDAGASHTCAVTTADRAFCWGRNQYGELGDGTLTQRRWPRAVAGGFDFNRIAAAYGHSCGITTGNRAYCWGLNTSGQLGDGTCGINRLRPVPVVGGLYFKQLSAGGWHTVAKTGTGAGYAWGSNFSVEATGSGSLLPIPTPTPIGNGDFNSC